MCVRAPLAPRLAAQASNMRAALLAQPDDGLRIRYRDLTLHTGKKEEKSLDYAKQIVEDRAEPQQIVATRPLYCLQHPLPIQVVCKRFFPAHIVIAIHEVDRRPFRPRARSSPAMVHKHQRCLIFTHFI